MASCCSGLFRNDKERGIRHLDSRQSFYTGLSQGGPGGSIGSTPGCGYPQLTNTAKKSRTLGGPNGLLTSGLSGNNFANTTSRVRIIYLLLFSFPLFTHEKRPKITILSLSSIAISLPIDKLDLALGVL